MNVDDLYPKIPTDQGEDGEVKGARENNGMWVWVGLSEGHQVTIYVPLSPFLGHKRTLVLVSL